MRCSESSSERSKSGLDSLIFAVIGATKPCLDGAPPEPEECKGPRKPADKELEEQAARPRIEIGQDNRSHRPSEIGCSVCYRKLDVSPEVGTGPIALMTLKILEA